MRTLTNLVLILVGLLLLSACTEPMPLEPEPVAVKDCMTASGVWYNCDTPSDTLPPCRRDPRCVPILPPPPED